MHLLGATLLVFFICGTMVKAQVSTYPVTGSTDGAPTGPMTATTEEPSLLDSEKLLNFYLGNHIIRTLLGVPSPVVCGQKCASLGDCKSLNYHEAGGVCELNGADRLEFPDDLTEERGRNVVYIGRDSPILNVNQSTSSCVCCDNACQNGAYCVPHDASNAETTRAYRCVCSSGWTGVNCEVMIARWSSWTAWGACSTTCGPGKRSRTRECLGTMHAGDSCLGDEVENRNCWNQESCAEWTAWVDVGSCSTSPTCGQGTVDRVRVCQGSQTNCEGPDTQTAKCSTVSCQAAWRLTGGTNAGEGRLEVYSTVHRAWGTVCFDNWDRWDTDVACRTLGFLPPPSYMEPGFDTLCDDGWLPYEGFCYWGDGIQSVNFQQAEQICLGFASHLVSILTEEENDFVKATFIGTNRVWLGAHNGILDGGLIRTSMSWSDGNLPVFRSEQLQNAVPNADRLRCLILRPSGNWWVGSCGAKKDVVCKKYPHFSLQFSPGEGPIHVSDMDCKGCEDHLSQCHHGNWHNVTSCTHSQDVGMKCSVPCPIYNSDVMNKARFPFRPLDAQSLVIYFTLKTNGTARVILSNSETVDGSIYSVVLSASSPSSIYRHASDTYHAETLPPAIRTSVTHEEFWVTKEGDMIEISRSAEGAAFLSWTDDQPGTAGVDGQNLYIGFASSQPAEWQFTSFCKANDEDDSL